MELLELKFFRSTAPWCMMRRNFRFWLAALILLCPGSKHSSQLFVAGTAMRHVAHAAVLSILVQQMKQKALSARALSHSTHVNSLETYGSIHSELRDHLRNNGGSPCKNSILAGTTADSNTENAVSETSTNTTKERKSNIMFFNHPASFLQSTLPSSWSGFGRPADASNGEPPTPAGRFSRLVSRVLLAKRARLKRLQQEKPPAHSQTELHTQTRILSKRPESNVNVLELLAVEEVSCRRAHQAIVAIDGGSSKTQPSLFSVVTESCTEGKRAGRHVLGDTLKFVDDGGKFEGVRQLLEKWLQRVATQESDEPKQPQAITRYQKYLLQVGFPLLERAAEELVSNILVDMVELIEKRMSKAEQREAESLAIPVIFHSTAGLRDFPRWYREGLFTALRRAINSAPPVKGFIFFTNQEFTRPISGHFEGICAFLTANYLLGNLARMRIELQAHAQTGSESWLTRASAQAGDSTRLLGQEAELSRRTEEPAGESEDATLRRVFAGSAASREKDPNDNHTAAFECANGDCSAVSFSRKNAITRCRSEIPDIRFCAHEYLAAVVESGGASMQLAFPVRRLDLLPPETRLYNLQRSGFLSDDYPPTDVVAVSFMQLGSNSAGGLFLKILCAQGSAFVSDDGLCTNPCFHKGYDQPCSAGEVVISNSGEVTVLEDALHNRLRPAAVFCGEDNAEVLVKTSTEVECRASKLDPLEPLQRRLHLSNCRRIVGSGNFNQCVDAVNSYLINPQFPLPANQEAVAAGFENPSQIFNFFSSRAPLLITGNSLVMPMRNLQMAGFLPQEALLFTEKNIDEIRKASENYCTTPVVRDPSGALRLSRNGTVGQTKLPGSETGDASVFSDIQTDVSLPGSAASAPSASALGEGRGTAEEEDVATGSAGRMGLKIDALNYENCQRLATIVALLSTIYAGVEKPSHVFFTNVLQATAGVAEGNQQKGDQSPKVLGKLGWQVGTILRHMSNEGRWRKMVYELGAAHSLQDRIAREKRSGAESTG